MAVTLGTNCGFVTTAPTSDPGGTAEIIDSQSTALKDTSPATATKVTEIGWWCDNATQESNFEVGIYSDDATSVPNLLLAGASQTNAKGTGAGWKSVTGLNITISPNTVYWIAIQLDFTSTPTNTDRNGTGTADVSEKTSSTLPTDWGTETNNRTNHYTIYAVWTGATGTNCQINIGDSWKAIAAEKINIGDTWKTVAAKKINIGDTWKTIF